MLESLMTKLSSGEWREPLIVAPYSEARRGNSHVERRPVGDLSEKASDQFSGGTPMEVVYPRCSGLDVHKRFVVAALEHHPEWTASQRTPAGQYHDQRHPGVKRLAEGIRMSPDCLTLSL
jgi:hypothetical protein